jgi:hypothetical protein
VPEAWSAPVRVVLAEMERRAADPGVSDADLLAWIKAETARLPELAGAMDTEGLAASMQAGMDAAVKRTLEAATGA